eukprot:5438364-Pyramimonas_sp.AAC.1
MKGVAVPLNRGVELPEMAFWHDFGSSKRNDQVDPWRWNPEINGPMTREFGGKVYANIVDDSWVYTGPPSPLPFPPS